MERNQEYAQAPKEKLMAVREQTTNAHQELAKFINAYAVIGTTADYEPLINELNLDQQLQRGSKPSEGGQQYRV